MNAKASRLLMDVQLTTLPGGLRVATARMPQVDSVSIGVWVAVGGRHEPTALCGASHFIEHLLFKGTARRSARDISQAVEGRGGDLNAFTQEESTCYYARVAADHAWAALNVLGDMYHRPRFDPADVDKERDVIIEEIMMYRDQPHHQVEEWLGELLWDGHPLGRPLTGRLETLKRLNRTRLVGFKEALYTPRNTVVAFAGRVDHAACVERVRREWGTCRGGRAAGGRRVDGGVGQNRLRVQTKDIEQAHLAMGFRLFGRNDPRRYALRLLSVVLGENMSSRLFQVVREKHGLAYAIQSGVHLYADTGVLGISAGLDRCRLDKAIDLVVREIVRMKAAPVGARELQRAKDYAVGQLRLGLEGTTNQMIWIGDNYTTFGRFVSPEECIDALRAVTAADLRRLAGEVLRASRVSVALIAPDLGPAAEQRVEAALRRLN
jgi:predicted Zn-dependent peptidase